MLNVVLPLFNLGTAAVALGLCRAAVAETTAHLKTARFEHLGQSLGESLPTLRAQLAAMQIETDGLAALPPPCCSTFLPVDHELKHVLDERSPDKDTDRRLIAHFVPQILEAAKAAVRCADTVVPGKMRPVVERDVGGHRIVSYVGQRPFTDDFAPPAKRIIHWGDGSPGQHHGALESASRLLEPPR
jgi:alkylation response protein AidB-like acyl-CoA dehydrogenase